MFLEVVISTPLTQQGVGALTAGTEVRRLKLNFQGAFDYLWR